MPSSKSRTRYTKAKPFGLRSSRSSVSRRRVSGVSASVRGAASQTKKPGRVGPRPTRVRKRARHAALLAANRVQRFFRHSLVTSAGLLSLLLIAGIALTGRAQSSGTAAYRAQPAACSGWENADRATNLDVLSNGVPTADISATVASRKPGDASSVDPLLKCKGFSLPEEFPAEADFTNPTLVVSLAAQGNAASEDAFVLESSLDGQQWTKLDSFFLTEDVSNVSHGGYWRFPFPTLTRDALSTLQVRARFVTVPSDTSVAVYVDGFTVEAGAKPTVKRESLVLPKDAVSIDKQIVKPTDEPVVSVQVSKPSRLKFLGVKDTARTVESVAVTGPDGKVMAATYDVTNVQTSKGVVAKYAIHTDGFSKPGMYTTELTVVEGNKEAIVTSEFLWGVLVINMDKSVYWPGETVSFGMGVVNAEGHTVCDASLTLRIVAPDGSEKVLTTEQEDGVQRSTTCGPDNVTDVADYSAEYETFDEGTYTVTLTAKTQEGEYTISDAVVVDAVIPIAIGRRGSMRIFPPAQYTMAVDVRPQQQYRGTVEEYVPPSFTILKVSDGGTVIKGQQRTTIRWQVDIPDHTLKTLTYRYDAPDISPELFRLGPLQVGDVQESRQWQIASDAIGAAAPTRLWMTGFESSEAATSTPAADNEYTANVNSPTVSGTTVRSGSYSLRANPSSSTQGMSYNFRASNDATGTYFRVYMRFATLPAGNTTLIAINDSGPSTQASVRFVSSSNVLQLWDDDGTLSNGVAEQVGSNSAIIATNTWYRVEMRVDFGTGSSGNTILAARLDGVEFASSTNRNWVNGIMTLQAGIITTSTSADMFLDDFAINVDSTNSVAGEGYPGPGSIVYLRPNGNGTNTAWPNCTGAGCVADYQSVDEVVPETTNSQTDLYVSCSGSQTEDYTLTDATSSGIDANDEIRLMMAMARAGAGSSTLGRNYSLVIGDGTTFNTATVVTFQNNNTTFYMNDDSSPRNVTTTVDATGAVTTGMISYDQPGATVAPWTPTGVNSAQVRLASTDCSPVMNVDTIWVEVEYIPAEGGRLWTSGFELQSVTAGVEYTTNAGTNPAISTTAGTFRSGAASLRTNPSGALMAMSNDFGTGDVTDDFYARAYVRMATRPNSNTKIMVFRDNAGTDQASIRYDNANNTLELWDEEGTGGTPIQVGSDSSRVIATNTWYMLELKVDTTTIGSTALAARIDNQEFASGTVNHDNGVKSLLLGAVTTSTTADMYWDDAALNQGLGATQNSYPGPGSVVAMQPNATGDNTAWAVSISCVAVDYTCVDEVTPNDATDAVGSSTLNQTEDNNFETAANAGIGTNDAITLVHAGIRFNVSSATATSVKVRLKAAASGPVVESFETTASTTTWTTNTPSGPLTYPVTAYDLPHRSTGWTPTDLDSAQVGVRISNDSAVNFQLSTMWLMVEYVPKITITGTVFAGVTQSTGFGCNIIAIPLATTTNAGPTRTTTNAGATMECTAADGTYTVYADAPNNAGDPVVVFVPTVLMNATSVTLANDTTSAISNFEVRDTALIVRHENAGPMTNAKLALADNGHAEIEYAVTGSDISVTNGVHFFVGRAGTAYTYDPGGAVSMGSSGDFRVDDNAIAYLDTNGNNVRDVYVDGSATLYIDDVTNITGGDIVTAGTSATVAYSTGTPTIYITGTGNIGGGTTPSITFYHFVIGYLTSGTITLTSPIAVDGDLNSLDGTLNANQNVTVGDDLFGVANLTYTSGTPTITMTCTDATCNFGTGAAGGTWKVYNLTTSGTGTITVQRDWTLAGDLTVGSGTTLTYTGTPILTTNGTKAITGTGTRTLYSLQVAESGTAATTTISATTRIDGDINVGAGATNGTLTHSASINYYGFSIVTNTAGSSIGYTSTPTFNVYGNGSTNISGSGTMSFYNLNIGDGSLQNITETSCTITLGNNLSVNGASSVFRTASASMNIGGSITVASTGILTYSGGASTYTYTFTGISKAVSGLGSFLFPGITTSGSATLTMSSAATVGGDVFVGDGTTLTVNANLTINGGDLSSPSGSPTGTGVVTYTSGTPTLQLGGTGNFGNAGNWKFYNLDFYTGGANITTTTLGSGTVTIDKQLFTRVYAVDPEFGPFYYHTLLAGSKTWILTASGVGTSGPFQNESNKFQGQTSTFKYTGTSNTDITFTNNATTNYFYNLTLEPASDSTQTHKLPTTLIVTNNLTMGRGGDFLDIGVLTVDAATNDPNVTVAGTVSCAVPGGENGVALSLGANTWTVGNFNTQYCWYGVTYDTGSTVKMNLAGGTITNTYTLYNLTIDPATAGTVTTTANHTVANTLTVESGDTYSINASRQTNMGSSSTEIAGTGTISGAGKIAFTATSAGPGTTVTIDAIALYIATASIASTTFDARTYGNDVEITNSGGASATVTCASGTYTLSSTTGDLLLTASGAGSVTLDCSTNDPTWDINGDIDYLGAGAGTESITTGAGTWTVSGNVNLTSGTLTTETGHTLVMDGTSKTLTTNSQTLQNATLSGTITLASSTHTFAGDVTLSGTITCTLLCTVKMTGTSNTLVGGGNTIGSLTIDPASAGTITLDTSDLTVNGTRFQVSAGDAFTIASGRTLTVDQASLGWAHSGTLNGPGRLIYRDNGDDAIPTGGTLASNIILRIDKNQASTLTLPARTDYEYLEIDNSSSTAGYTVTAAAGTITVNDNLDLLNTGTGSSTTILNLDTNDPTFSVTGNTTIAADTTLTAPSGGALNLGGNYTNSGTFTDSGGTVTLNGTGTQTLSGTMTGSSDFNSLTITNSSGAVSGCSTSFTPGVAFGADATMSGTYTITTAGVKVQYNSGSTYTVTNINWVGAIGNLIYFRNSNLSAGSWILNVSGTQTVQYVDVARSDATPGVDITANDGTSNDCGNNPGWVFTTGINISGTSNSSGGTVRVAVNGTEQAQTTTLAGSWTISSVSVSNGNVVVVYVEGVDSAETTGVSQYDGTGDMTGFVLDTNVLTVGNGDNQTIDLTDLAGYDCDNDEDVMFSSNAGTFAVEGCTNSYTDETLSTLASNTLSVGNSQTVTSDNFTNAGTVTSGTLGVFTVSGNWTNSSTFTPSTSTVTFSATDTGHTINNGASSFYNVTFDGSGGAWSPLTNTFTATNDLIMTNGTFNTATGTANVTVNGNVQCGASCGTITMNSAGTNTFTQSVSASKSFGTNVAVATNWTFYNLTFTAASGTPTITTNATGTGQIIVANTLATTNSGTSLVVDNETNDRILDVNGAVSIGSGTTLQASSTASFTVGGNWTNNGDFTDNSGTVTLDGSSQQTVDGQLTGASDRFNNLTITNASGSDPDSSPSVIFAASADTAGTFTAATASTKIRFLAGGTYTFQNISFNGQASGTRVALRSATPGTQWNINVAGTRSVQYTDVKDSNACGQAPDIEADDGTNANGGNDACWKITTLSVVLSGTTAALGTLATGFVNQAGITSTVTTSAAGGYISMVKYNNTLTSGLDTIPDTAGGTIVAGTAEFGASSSDSGNTIGIWSPTACSTTATTSNATALTTAYQAFAAATGVVTGEATTLCFLASITGTTPAGSYSSTATVVTTARF